MPKKPAASARVGTGLGPVHAERISAPVVTLPVVTLSPRGVARIKSGHPWVYRSDIAAAENVPPGAMVRVADSRGKVLGTALYSSASQIAIRMIGGSHAEVSDLPALVSERIRAAIGYRKQVVSDSDAYRVVFSEADFLPGLIIDRYNDVVSVQILTQAMDAEPVRGAVIATLVEELQPAGIVERVDPRIRELEQLAPRASGLLWGKKSSTIISMNAAATRFSESLEAKSERPSSGVRFHYDALEGQKSGAFLDQRENYAVRGSVWPRSGARRLLLSGRICAPSGRGQSRAQMRQRHWRRQFAPRARDGREECRA